MGGSDNNPISISVTTDYIEDQSRPESGRYAFAYTVTITNTGSRPAKLISRHWIITDADNRVQEVRGEGVVGVQPRLEPGVSFEYTSGTILETPVGTMEGSYQMVEDDGAEFDAQIPIFTLSAPKTLH